MSEVKTPRSKKPAAEKAAPKPGAEKAEPKAQSKAPASEKAPEPQAARSPEASEQAPRGAYEPKQVGAATFQLKDMPPVMMEAAKQRFGRPGLDMQVAAARENGTYKGEVLAGQDYLAQKVGENSVVFHQKTDIELVSEKHRANPDRVNGAQLAIHYNGAEAKAYPHDPQREQLEIMVNTMKKQAAKLDLPDRDKFVQALDKVKEGMWADMSQRREAQLQQRKEQRQQQAPQQQHSRDRDR